MSDLIGEIQNSENVRVDEECPECGSGNVMASKTPGIPFDPDDPGSVWCDDCGYGWWA